MNGKMIVAAAALLVCAVMSDDAVAQVAEPGWGGPIIARGETRAEIESTPILERNYRPFHFYGNTVRRRYYRGTVAPAPQEVIRSSNSLFRVR